MILYYTATQKTKVFAEALCVVTGKPAYELLSPLNDKPTWRFLLHALYLALTGKPYPVSNMPQQVEADEIYVCAPIWGGNIAAPAWFFLNRAALKGKKVNLLLTCASLSGADGYRKKAEEALRLIDCVPGRVYILAADRNKPEKDVIVTQLREMLPA